MKIAIVGGSPVSRDYAPFEDQSWEIWGLANQIDRYFDKRIDRVFEIHDNLDEHGDPLQYWNFVKQVKVPLVVSPKHAEYGEPFPYDEVNAIMGVEMLTSSPAYMMGYAWLKYAKELTDLGIYGVEMALNDHEYFKQRPAMYAWIAFLKAKGVNIHIPEQSSLFKEGYCEGRDWNTKKGEDPFSIDQITIMEERHANHINDLQRQMDRHHGAMQAYKCMKQIARAKDAGAKNIDLDKCLVVK